MSKETPTEYCNRKADQHYEMAALARHDNDREDEAIHLKKAKEWEEKTKS